MTSLSEDPIINAINNGIKRDINVALENKCYRGGAILMLSAIDTMAFLAMPETQEDVARTDFIVWASKYIRFAGQEQLTGEDLYGARCAMLHSYGTRSRMSREGKCRVLGYMDISVPPIRYNPNVSKEVVLVSLAGLRDALFDAIDRFLVDLFKDRSSKISTVAEKRLNTVIHEYPTATL